MHQRTQEFDAFWLVYPNKKAKLDAQKAYAQARKRATAEDILVGVARYVQSKPEYADWKLPAGWLRAGRWMDEYAYDAPRAVEGVDAEDAFIRRFCELYTHHRHGARYFVKREKHVPLLRALLSTYGPDRLEKLAMVLLTTDDEWVQATDRGIGILSTKASWLEERLAAYEAKHGPVQVAS